MAPLPERQKLSLFTKLKVELNTCWEKYSRCSSNFFNADPRDFTTDFEASSSPKKARMHYKAYFLTLSLLVQNKFRVTGILWQKADRGWNEEMLLFEGGFQTTSCITPRSFEVKKVFFHVGERLWNRRREIQKSKIYTHDTKGELQRLWLLWAKPRGKFLSGSVSPFIIVLESMKIAEKFPFKASIY